MTLAFWRAVPLAVLCSLAAGCGTTADEAASLSLDTAQLAVAGPVCNLRITTNMRTIDSNQAWPGGAALHGGYRTEPVLQRTPPPRCQPQWPGFIQTMEDGEGFCAFSGEVIESFERVDCPTPPPDPVCNVIVTTNLRTINANTLWPGGAADRGGYTDEPGLQPANARCSRDGWSHMIRTMNDGEGWCAYENEILQDIQVVRCPSPPLHPVCNLRITTNQRTVDVNTQQPGGAQAHGGYRYFPSVIPTITDASHRCTLAGYGTLFRTFGDGEGFCGYDGESIVSVERTLCPPPPPEQICNLIITTDRRTLNVNQLWPDGAREHQGFQSTPSLQPALARCPATSTQLLSVFGDGEGWCAEPGETLLSTYRELCAP